MSAAGTSETWETHFSDHPDQGGAPTLDRFRDFHAAVLWDAFAKPLEEGAPWADLLMGAPASGKGTIQKLKLLRDESRAVRVDADDCKIKLPEFDGQGAVAVHEESSWLARQKRAVAIGRGCNLINDGVGADAAKYADLVGQLLRNGYSVRLHCVHVLDEEELLRRAAYRGERTGRFVPERVILDAHKQIPLTFNILRKRCHEAFLVDGMTAKLVWSRTLGSGVQVHDAIFVAKIKQAAGAILE